MAGFIPDAVSQDWCTPEWILAAVRQAMGVEQIDLDPCSNDTSIVKAKVEYKVPANDGLQDSWDYPTIFVNPPFGRSRMHIKTRTFFEEPPRAEGEPSAWSKLPAAQRAEYAVTDVGDWLRRCRDAARGSGSQVIALVPYTPETEGWRSFVWNDADAVCAFRKRVKFIDVNTGKEAEQGIPKPMAAIYWAGDAGLAGYERFDAAFGKLGTVLPIGRSLERMREDLRRLNQENAALREKLVEGLDVTVKAVDTTKASVLVFSGPSTWDITASDIAKFREHLRKHERVHAETAVLVMPEGDLEALRAEDLQPIIDRLKGLLNGTKAVSLPVLPS